MIASEVAVAGVEHRFGDAVALGGVDMTVAGGEFRTLLGPSRGSTRYGPGPMPQ